MNRDNDGQTAVEQVAVLQITGRKPALNKSFVYSRSRM